MSAELTVTAEVERILDELGLGRSRRRRLLDERFENLGLGSLELNELLARVERETGVALDSNVLAWAETPADLVEAIDRLMVAVADIETTGLYSNDRILEIAIVLLDGEGNTVDGWDRGHADRGYFGVRLFFDGDEILERVSPI